MLTRSLFSFGIFAAIAAATTTSASAAATSAVAATNGSAPTCFWSNGTAADTKHLQPCKTSLGNDGFFACCPPPDAKDLYPLDYPLCTENGLCKAGNSDFLARGGCTDKTLKSKSCPQYCPNSLQGGMAGLTNCEGRSPYFCCNTDHDEGQCNCSPPNGTAFQLQGTTPLFYKDLMNAAGSKNATSPSTTAKKAGGNAGKTHTGDCTSTVHKTKTATVKVPATTDGPPSPIVSTIFATPPQPTATPANGKPAGTPAAATSATVAPANPASANAVNLGLAVFAAAAVLLN